MKRAWLLAAAAVCAAQDLPQWAREAAAAQAPAYPAKVAAVVLLQEEHLTVEPDGKRVMRERGAVRVLQQSRDSVSAFRSYNSKSGRIRDFQGWVAGADGKARPLPKNLIVDQALSTGAVYDEYRAKSLDPGPLAPGSVFAYEVIEEERTVFVQSSYRFQGLEPVLISRFVLTMPAGWEVKSETINAPKLEPAVAGNTYTWELRNLPWIEPEDYAPAAFALAPRLGVTYFSGDTPALGNWSAVSAWMTQFVDPPAAVTAAIRAKAAELTANAATPLDRIRAIASYVQQTNYVSVQMNLTRGGGYTPNPADQVLARNYGDCKDKATLTRALLAAAGIESYATPIYWGERIYVRPEWPSPHVFNHMIAVVRVPADVKLPSAFDHPRLGRLLPFDPTDDSTPLGDLPRDQQGSHALVIAGGQGELVAMPLLPPSANRVESTTEASYSVDTSLTAKVARTYHGQPAARLRNTVKSQDQDRLKRSFESGLSRRLGGLTLTRLAPSDRMADGRLDLEMELTVKQFGQLMQGRLLVLAPGTLVPSPEYRFPGRERKRPVELTSSVRKDRVTIALPAPLKLDELPEPVKLDASFGSYKAEWGYDNGKLTFAHELEVRDALVPAADYLGVREFFDAVASAQGSAVVLLNR